MDDHEQHYGSENNQFYDVQDMSLDGSVVEGQPSQKYAL